VNPFVLFVPRLWAGEDALAAVRMLRQIIEAIWEVHGERMAGELEASPDRWRMDELLDVPGFDDIDDIPF
jgi:hypothetical protein